MTSKRGRGNKEAKKVLTVTGVEAVRASLASEQVRNKPALPLRQNQRLGVAGLNEPTKGSSYASNLH